MLVEETLVEKRRGLGMYVRAGGRALALSQERTHFLKEEWPKIRGRLASLEIDLETLPGLEKMS